MKGKRIFAAIDIADEAKEQIAAYVDVLRRDFGHLRVGWESAEKLHITVKFEGHLEYDQLNTFTATAGSAARELDSFDVTICGTGSFMKRRSQGILWLGLEADPLARLSQALRAPHQDENEHTRRSFNPHLTIARLREPQNSRKLIARHMASNFGPLVFRADELVVYESTLLPTGSVYTALSRHPFRREDSIWLPGASRRPL